jgi:NADPH:quinone reductase-like Zn-dependent oxidoreductase
VPGSGTTPALLTRDQDPQTDPDPSNRPTQVRGVLLSTVLGQRLVLLAAQERASGYDRLTDLIEAGQLVPSIDRAYPLEDTPLAVRQLEAGHVRGKVAITVDR